MSQCDRILAFLADGQPHTMEEVHVAVGFCRLNSRISELRERGHHIRCDRKNGHYVYQLLSSLGEPGYLADDGGDPLLRPPVAEPQHPQSTLPADQPGSPSDAEQLTFLVPKTKGAYYMAEEVA